MSDAIERAVVTFEGRTPPVDPGEAVEILRHLDAYEPPAEYSNRLSNVADLDPEDVDYAQLLWADHVPEATDLSEENPHVFAAGHEAERVWVRFRTTLDAVPEFDDALDHVFAVTPLEVDTLDAEVTVDDHVELDDVDVPAQGFSVMTAGGLDRTTVELGATSDVLEDATTTFSVADVFEPELDTVVEQATAAAGPLDRELVTVHGRTRPVDPAEAAEILTHVAAHEPPADLDESVATVDTIDADTVAEARLAWADHPPDAVEDTGPLNAVLFDGVPELRYASYDEYDDGRVSIVLKSTRERMADAQAFLDHVFAVADLEPEKLSVDLEPEADYDFDLDEIDPPEGLSTMLGMGSVTVSPADSTLAENTARTFSLEEFFEPAVRDVLAQLEALVDTGGPDLDWERVQELKADLDPAGDDPEDPIYEFHHGAATRESPEESVAHLAAIGHSVGTYRDEQLREQLVLEDEADVDDVLEGKEIETTVVERDIAPEEVPEVMAEYEQLSLVLAMMGIDEDALADLATRERLAIVDVDAVGEDDGGPSLVATEDGTWKIVH